MPVIDPDELDDVIDEMDKKIGTSLLMPFDEFKIAYALYAWEKLGSQQAACDTLAINPSTMYRWFRKAGLLKFVQDRFETKRSEALPSDDVIRGTLELYRSIALTASQLGISQSYIRKRGFRSLYRAQKNREPEPQSGSRDGSEEEGLVKPLPGLHDHEQAKENDDD